MDWLPLLGAFGLGSVVTALVQSYLTSRIAEKERGFQERKEAYVGLLEAYRQAAVEGTDVAAKNFAYWQMRCEIVGSEKVRSAIQSVIDTNDDKKGRSRAHDQLKRSMRNDLGISSDK